MENVGKGAKLDIGIWNLYHVEPAIEEYHYDVFFYCYLKRKFNSYISDIFIPVTLLSLLQLAALAIPADQPDRASFSATMFLALTVLDSSISNIIPVKPQIVVMDLYLLFSLATGVVITSYSLVMCRCLEKRSVREKLGMKIKIIGLTAIETIDLFIFSVNLLLLISFNVYFFSKVNGNKERK